MGLSALGMYHRNNGFYGHGNGISNMNVHKNAPSTFLMSHLMNQFSAVLLQQGTLSDIYCTN